ncbi:hypothetical protein [Azospirillum picis]|nr:hypothetical protein [Azospirillum picis]MBP2298970.1 hypothetical protein [Azospirillum picis]
MSAQSPAGGQKRFLTRLLYEKLPDGRTVGSVGCRPITQGNNASYPHPGKGYDAGPGFSAVAGWGVPDGQALLTALEQVGTGASA